MMADTSQRLQNGHNLTHQHSRPSATVRVHQNNVDGYSSSDYDSTDDTDSYEDSEPVWQEEALKAGELFYVEENEVLNDTTEKKHERNIKKPDLISDDNALIYKTAMPQPSTSASAAQRLVSLKSVHVQVDKATSYMQNVPANLLASMIGVIMLDMRIDNNVGNRPPKRKKIDVDVLVPGGLALRTGQINIGDVLIAVDDVCVTTDNIEMVLQAITKPKTIKLTFETTTIFRPRENFTQKILPIKTDFGSNFQKYTSVVTLLTPHSSRKSKDFSLDGPFGIYFLTLNLHSDTAAENDDLVYSYPLVETAVAPSKLAQIRGLFITLSDVIMETFSSRILSTTLVINEELIHCAYHQEGTEVLIMCVPAKAYSLPQVHLTMSNVVRLLDIMYGSVLFAFQPENKERLDHMFHFALVLNASTARITDHLLTSTSYKLPGIRRLVLDSELQVNIHAALAELEASDFDVGLSKASYSRRLYTVRGSCLFYDGCLLANHLPVDDLYDVSLFCYNHNLLGIREKERIGLLVIWREIHRWNGKSRKRDKNEFDEAEGRYFLLVVGLKRCLLCTLLQLNGKLFPASHTPRPDPKYVNHARGALINLESCNFFSELKRRLMQPSSIRLVPAQRFLLSKSSSFLRSSKPPAGQSKGFKLPFSSPLKFKSGASEAGTVRASSPNRTSGSEVTKTTSRSLFREKSFSSQGSADSAGSPRMQTKTASSAVDGARQQSSSSTPSAPESSRIITSGPENCLFSFVKFEELQGVLITPTELELNIVASPVHQGIVSNFKKYALILHQRFAVKNQSSDYCIEEGILFQYSSRNDESTKHPQFLQYWVVGRKIRKPVPHELYVCFHNTAPQSMVELAFRSAMNT